MIIHGSVIQEQGVKFAIVIVRPEGLNDPNGTRAAFQGLFPGLPLVLARQDARGLFEYQGRNDLVDFLASIDSRRIPWKEYTVS